MKSYLLAILLASLISLPAMAATKAVIVYDLFPKFLPVESRVLDVMNAS